MCCSGFLKIMMFIFNGAIFLAGAVILGVGVWVKVDSDSLFGILEHVEHSPSGSQLSQLVYVSYLLIAVGAVLVVTGFLGCCGAVKESRCMLLTFFIIVLIIFLAEVAGAIVLLVFQNVAEELLNGVEKDVRSSIQSGYGSNEGLTAIWNNTMNELKCCGFKNYTDFTGSPYTDMHGGNLYPPACCWANTTDACTSTNAHKARVDGCFQKLLDLIEENAVIIAAVALGIVALEIAAMVVSMILYKDIGTKA